MYSGEFAGLAHLLGPEAALDLTDVGLAQEVHAEAGLAYAAADGVGEFAGEQLPVEQQLSLILLALDGKLLAQCGVASRRKAEELIERGSVKVNGETAKLGDKVDFAINVDVPDENIVRRMSGRRACLKCGATYHIVYNAPKTEGVCDSCGSELVQREDDKPETVKKRLDVYFRSLFIFLFKLNFYFIICF